MAPSIKNFATPVLLFEAHVAQKCVLERSHTKLCLVSYELNAYGWGPKIALSC